MKFDRYGKGTEWQGEIGHDVKDSVEQTQFYEWFVPAYEKRWFQNRHKIVFQYETDTVADITKSQTYWSLTFSEALSFIEDWKKNNGKAKL